MKLIKFIGLISICFYISIKSYAQDCSMLEDGKYKVVYDKASKHYPKYEFRIKGDKYIIRNNKKKKLRLEIFKQGKCRFTIETDTTIVTNNFTELAKFLNRRPPFYDIVKVENNIYYFVLRLDLHVQICSGKFIKMEK